MRTGRLIWLAVLPAVLLAWMMLVSIDAIFTLLGEVDEIGIGDYDGIKVLTYVALTLPRRAHDFFFGAAAVGLLVGLGGLASTSQLIALQAAGAGRVRIAAWGLSVIAALLVVVLILGQWLGPAGDRLGTAMVTSARQQSAAVSASGIWFKERNAVWNAKFLHTPPAGVIELWDVLRLQTDEQGRLQRIDRAARAVPVDGAWVFHDSVRMVLVDSRIERTKHKRQQLESTLEAEQIAARIIGPKQQAPTELLRSIRYAEANGLDPRNFESALWFKLSYPVVVISLCLLALPFCFGSLRTGGLGKRIFLGMTLAICFHFFHRAIINYGESQGFSLPLVYLVPPFVVGAYGLRRLIRQ
ncbi:MAG: LPS export ABC transporter permease LptG [Xanthomonadales bacterium]|nr:LPS export ABC transporter permease LptG [Xanthomonadales bacterium]